MRSVFGGLGDDPEFVAELAAVLEALDNDGVRATMVTFLSSSDQLLP